MIAAWAQCPGPESTHLVLSSSGERAGYELSCVRVWIMVFISPQRFGRTLLIVSVCVVAGCQEPEAVTVVPEKAYDARAILAAVSSNDITMFGENEAGMNVKFSTRTAISLQQHTQADVGRDFDANIDWTGQRVVFASTRHNQLPDLYIKSVDGVSVTQLSADPASDVQPVFSPDGKRVAFASDRSGNWDIWIIGVDGKPPVQVTSGHANEMHPSWSPDGSQLVFCSLRAESGQWELWIVDAMAGSQKSFIGYGMFPEWSPTGDVIVYQRARERGTQAFSIWTLTMVDGEPRYPTEVAASASQAMIAPTWSPTGDQIAFSATSVDALATPDAMGRVGDGVFDIWLMDARGRGKVRLTDGHTFNYGPTFSPNGRIFFTSDRSGHDCLWSVLPGGYFETRGIDHDTAASVPTPKAKTVRTVEMGSSPNG